MKNSPKIFAGRPLKANWEKMGASFENCIIVKCFCGNECISRPELEKQAISTLSATHDIIFVCSECVTETLFKKQ